MPLYEKLDDCQRKAVRAAIRRRSVCIFFEQGVGKTHPTVSIAEELAADIENFEALFVVPLTNLHSTWTTLLDKECPHLNWTTDWDEYKKLSCPKIFIVHYEGLKPLDKKITKHKWTMAMCDESHRIKARGTKQSRICGRIKLAMYRIALSGTPIDESPIDLYAQIRFVAPQLYGNDVSAWTRFQQEYLVPTGYMGYQRKFTKKTLARYLKEIAPYILRVEASEVLNLPKNTIIHVPVKMRGEQLRVYKDMERDMVAKIMAEAKEKARKKSIAYYKKTGKQKTFRASAGLRITQMIKLQQICGGYITEDEDNEIIPLPSAKLRKLEYLLECKAKFPAVIFCKYRYELHQIEELATRLGLRHLSIHGKIKDKKKKKARTEVIQKFQAGKLDLAICQIKAGGVGVDFFTGRSDFFYSTTFSFIDYDQARRRIFRRGQVNPTTSYFLFCENTIDEDIYSAIISKMSVSKSIFKTMKTMMFKSMKRRSLQNVY